MFSVCHVLPAAVLPHSEGRTESLKTCREIPLRQNGGVCLVLVCSYPNIYIIHLINLLFSEICRSVEFVKCGLTDECWKLDHGMRVQEDMISCALMV